MKKYALKSFILLLILVVGIYTFGAYGVGEKLSRFVTIMGNIAYSLSVAKPAYEDFDFNITDEELAKIDVEEIAKNFKSSIDKKKEKKEVIPSVPQEIAADEIREEEVLKHTKTIIKKADLVSLDDLPAKFKPLKQFLHEPFKMGACRICHTSKNNKPGELVKKKITDICYSCHKTRYTKEFDHKPVKDGKCMDCHDPHQSNTKSLLKAASINDLCMKCHDKKSSFKAKAKKKYINMNQPVKHEPIVKKNCLECHDAHTADYKSLLSLDSKMDLCLDCHDDIADKVHDSKYKHGGVNTSKKRCLECHDPHATRHKKLLKKDPVATCLQCHDKEVKSDEDGGMLMNMKKHLQENKNWHKPIKEPNTKDGGCGACHEPHGSNNFSILRKSFTKNFYDNFENKDFFCFKCHKENKISMQYIEPEDSNVTSFRDGDVNLHYLHVNDRKGRSCRACHDEHASKYTHLIRDYTDFNGIKFPLRYIDTGSGGSCAPACHKKFEYDRLEPKGIGR